MAPRRRQLTLNFNLGNGVAESDPLLESAFYDSAAYQMVESKNQPHCLFLVGRTGSGKSAILKHLEDLHPAHVIRIIPENLSLPYISNLDVMHKLTQANVLPDPFFVALWKHVLLVELIQHRYKIMSPQVKQNVLNALMDKLRGDSKKRKALEYLNEFSGKFWCPTDERVRDIIDHFESQLKFDVAAQVNIALAGNAGARLHADRQHVREVHSEQAERYKLVVNEAQIARLNEMIKVLDEDILESDQHFTYVIIDDLDKDWVEEAIANDLLRCLLRALWDLQRVQHLKVIVALRTNIFEYLDFGSPMRGQEEKYRALTQRVRWSVNGLEDFADTRAKAAGQMWGVSGGITSVRQLLPRAGKKRGDPLHFMIERTLLRPRDLISYFNEALALSGGRPLVWRDIDAAEPVYSRNRLLALRDEWKATFPGIEDVFEIFRQTPQPLPFPLMMEKIIEVAVLADKPNFSGLAWLELRAQGMWCKDNATWAEQYQPLLKLLFEIGFLGCISQSKAVIYAQDQPDYADSALHLQEAVAFSIHPAFRSALDIEIPRRNTEGT